jgi:hypothetical protein
LASQYRDEGWLALERDDALRRTAGADETLRQTAGSSAELENRARPSQVDAARDRVGETGATRIGGGDSQRFLQPKGKKDTCIRGHAVTFLVGQYHYSITSMLQFCERYILRTSL